MVTLGRLRPETHAGGGNQLLQLVAFLPLGSEQVFPTYSKNILSIFPLAFYVYYFYLKKIVLMIL